MIVSYVAISADFENEILPNPTWEFFYSWWRHQIVTFSAFFGPLCGEFTGHRWIPLTKASDAGHWCNKQLSIQSWDWWFETPSRSLWRHCNVQSAFKLTDFFRKKVDVSRTSLYTRKPPLSIPRCKIDVNSHLALICTSVSFIWHQMVSTHVRYFILMI